MYKHKQERKKLILQVGAFFGCIASVVFWFCFDIRVRTHCSIDDSIGKCGFSSNILVLFILAHKFISALFYIASHTSSHFLFTRPLRLVPFWITTNSYVYNTHNMYALYNHYLYTKLLLNDTILTAKTKCDVGIVLWSVWRVHFVFLFHIFDGCCSFAFVVSLFF